VWVHWIPAKGKNKECCLVLYHTAENKVRLCKVEKGGEEAIV